MIIAQPRYQPIYIVLLASRLPVPAWCIEMSPTFGPDHSNLAGTPTTFVLDALPYSDVQRSLHMNWFRTPVALSLSQYFSTIGCDMKGWGRKHWLLAVHVGHHRRRYWDASVWRGITTDRGRVPSVTVADGLPCAAYELKKGAAVVLARAPLPQLEGCPRVKLTRWSPRGYPNAIVVGSEGFSRVLETSRGFNFIWYNFRYY